MQKLIEAINQLKNSEVKQLVDSRIAEFKEIRKNENNSLFKELCFCLLTANYSAEGGIKIQKEVGNGFITLSEVELRDTLKSLGHRFYSARAAYITLARRHNKVLKMFMDTLGEYALREWLVKNVKGLGYKEASHFMRNTGYKNVAIIDFHIIDLLVRHKLIKRPNTLTSKKYLEIEGVLKEIAKQTNLNLAELDFYLWYMETGKVLK
ncbi:MAG: N-glycosylase/DNA lyase [Nanoarchaeota archaeon]|nr:N-glycosylase/DNA lyase [Nanoarchaeota archaeon]